MTKSKSSASSTIVSSIFDTFSNGAQLLNGTCAAGTATTVISPLNKM